MAKNAPKTAAIRRTVGTAHRKLAARIASVHTDLKRDRRAAGRSLRQLRDALDVHFAQEELLYYPVIVALSPKGKVTLKTLVRVHARLRATLAEVARDATGATAERAFAAFVTALVRHEAAERAHLSRLQRKVAPG